MASLSPPRTSTSGRAPVLRATMRFWISVESLKRPPTLLTIASSFSSSSIPAPFLKSLCDQVADLGDRRFQIVVDNHVIEFTHPFQFAPRRRQPHGDFLFRFGVSLAQ